MSPTAQTASPPLRLLADKREDPGYRPSYDIGAPDLGPAQHAACAAVSDIPGWLRPEDALKLYELAGFAPGPILEIGAYHGKSSTLMALALRDTGNYVPLLSVDVDPVALRDAAATAARHDVADRVTYVRGTAAALFAAMPGYRPTTVFVDGDHSLGGTRRDLDALRDRVPRGAVLLMHDYNDPRNADPAEPEYGVVEAVGSSWMRDDCSFGGVFGCCALFRRERGGPDPALAAAPILDVVIRDSPRLQLLQRVRWPLGRRLRALGLRGGERPAR